MQKELINWYRSNKRDLPWRQSRNPYFIWISEVMLQQTTVVAVIPYFQKFIKRFPKVDDLAKADESDVLEMWAGLGYYSRARNLHKAAQIIHKTGFPKKAEDLLKLPGFGPYTSRAVASIAFNEPVGVLDGNVIRILSRAHGLKTKWWQPQERSHLQKLSDELANSPYNSEINQAMMELGATLCTPKKPLCVLCPWKSDCVALKKNKVLELPISRPKQKNEIWFWKMNIQTKKNQIYLEKNKTTPFLPDLLFPPGKAQIMKKKPNHYDVTHSVTKYKIYIELTNSKSSKTAKSNWFDLATAHRVNHSSLMTKILKKIK